MVGYWQLLTLLVTLVVVGLLVSFRAFDDSLLPYQTRWVTTGMLGLGLVSMAALTFRRRRYGRTETNDHSQHSSHIPHGAVVDGHDSLHVDHMGFFLEKYATTLGIYIFGGGSLFMQVCYLIRCLQCFEHFCGPNVNDTGGPGNDTGLPEHACADEVSKLALHFVSIPFYALQMPFLHSFSQFRRRRQSFAAHHATLVLIAANFAMWLYTFLRDSDILKTYYPDEITGGAELDVPLSRACRDHRTVLDAYVESTLSMTLAPLTMEFILAAIEILVGVWLLPCPRAQPLTPEHTPILQRRSSPSGRQQQEQEASWAAGFLTGVAAASAAAVRHRSAGGAAATTAAADSDVSDSDDDLDRTVAGFHYVPVPRRIHIPRLPPAEDGGDFQPHWRHRIWVWFIRRFNIYTAVMFGMVELGLVTYYNLHQDLPSIYMNRTEFNENVAYPVLVGVILVDNVPGLIVACHCWAVMRTFRQRRPHVPRLHGSDVILILATVAVIALTVYEEFVYICQSLRPDISTFSRWKNVTGAFLVLTAAPQTILSALVICYGQRWVANVRHRYYGTLQRSLTYLTVYSFVQWIKSSFFELDCLDFGTEIESRRIPDIFVHLFTPACIYFRFLSVILFLKVKNLMREAEVRWHMEHSATGSSRGYGTIQGQQ